MGLISAPERLQPEHDLSRFDSGEPILDQWLRKRALGNESSGASRTYVIHMNGIVVGYYSLAVGSIAHSQTPGRIRRNMPDPIPAMILGRLAVDRTQQGSGLGSALLRDAILRTFQAAEIAGIRVMLVHAISERVRKFYMDRGFLASLVDPLTVMISLQEISRTLPQ